MKTNELFDIYVITNKVNNKHYVGVTCQGVDVRWKAHLASAYDSNSQAPIHVAMREFGEDNFVVEVVLSGVTEADGRSKELEYIEKYNSNEPYGYNTYRAGMGGHHHTEEGRQNISKGLTGHVFSEERNEKVRQAMREREYKQEWSDKLSEVKKGVQAGERNPFYGKKHSPELLKQIAETRNQTKFLDVEYTKTDSGEVIVFSSLRDAAKYVMANGLANTSVDTCVGRISRNCRKGSIRPFYGGIWRFKKRFID